MSAFPLSEARWLEPPSRAHHTLCARENGVWYACPDCGCVFDALEGVRNVCPVCGTFSKRVTECTCGYLGD